MDVTPYLSELKTAPAALFDALADRGPRPRYVIPTPSGERVVTWNEHAAEVKHVALGLAALGFALGDVGAIFAPNRVEWMSAALGVQAAGGVMVPIYPASTPAQAAYVVKHSDARVVFVDTPALAKRLFERWSEMDGVRAVVLFEDAIDAAKITAALRAEGKEAPTDADLATRVHKFSALVSRGAQIAKEDERAFGRRMAEISLDQPGLMLYTSGTSGNPKGVPLSHRNVAVNGRDWLESNAPLLDESSVDLLWLPMSHIFGFGEACLGNTLGFLTHMTDPISVLDKLPTHRPNVFMSVPSVWEKLAVRAMEEKTREKVREKLRAITGGRLRFCLSGGAGLKLEVKELFHDAGILIIEGYGLTETSPTLTLNRPDAFRFDSVGKPLPSVELRLAEDGEILARGPSVFRGYHKDPDATKGAFDDDGWFKTGDVGRFTDDGFLQIIDRKKDILVTAGGKNVPPANIEGRFRDDALFAHVVVYGDGKKFLSAGVWLNSDAVRAELGDRAASREAIETLVADRIEKVNRELASFESIKRFAVMEQPLTVEGGHLTATLKVRRKHVYEAFRAAFEALYA